MNSLNDFTSKEFFILQEELLNRPLVVRDLINRGIDVKSPEAVIYYYDRYLTTFHNPWHPDNAHLIPNCFITKIYLDWSEVQIAC